jgi:pyrimidine operon attenuation protein / uracil phosphoribosyltransferase
MENTRVITENAQFDIIIERLCYQLIEDYNDFENTCIVGIQSGGVQLAERLIEKLTDILRGCIIPLGKLDITFYRDDFRTSKKPLAAQENDMPFIIENLKVILVDDVLYTGRSVQSALTALNHYGRPHSVKLLVLVDRRFHRQIPVRPDYIGLSIDSVDEAYVHVEWGENSKNTFENPSVATKGGDKILLTNKK